MLEKITALLRNYKDDETIDVSNSTTFEDLGLDSLDMAQLVMEIEDEFGVTIEMDKAIKDVGALIEVIEGSK